MLFFALYSILIFLLLMVANDHRKVTWLVLLSIIVYWGFSLVDAIDIPGYMFAFECMNTHGDPRESYYGVFEGSYGGFEYGFLLAMQLSKRIIPYFEFFQLFLFAVEVLLVYKGVKGLGGENERYTPIMLCMMAFSLSFSLLGAMRQGVVVALFVRSLPFFCEKKYLKCVVCLVVGSLFHSSSILLLLIYLFCWLFERYKKFFFSHSVLLFVLIVCDMIYFLQLSVGGVFGTVLSSVSLSYGSYYDSFMQISNFGFLKLLEMNVCFVLAFFTPFLKRTSNYNLLASLFFLYFIFNTISGGMAVHRINYYLSIPYILLLVESLVAFLKRINIKSTISLVIVFFYMFGIFAYQNSMFVNYPYNYYILHFIS